MEEDIIVIHRTSTFSNLLQLMDESQPFRMVNEYVTIHTQRNQSAVFEIVSQPDPYTCRLDINECMERQCGLSDLFRTKNPTVILTIKTELLPDAFRLYVIECYCISAMMVLKGDDMYVASIKPDTDYMQFTLLLYKTTLDEIHHESGKLILSILQKVEYKPIVCLDLDKTLYICDQDCASSGFKSDVAIKTTLALDKTAIHHHMMIRPGAHMFLKRLLKLARVYCITAGDLHYAREAVTQANLIHWSSCIDSSLPEGYVLEPVHIPIENVISVRNCKPSFISKTFSHVIPLYHSKSNCVPMIAVDDDITAWNVSDRSNVVKITPFYPSNTLPHALLKIIDALETVFTPEYLEQRRTGKEQTDYMVRLYEYMSVL